MGKKTPMPKSKRTLKTPALNADRQIKEDIYVAIAKRIQERTGGLRPGREFTKALFEMVMDMMFQYAMHAGAFRFPKGLGMLYLKTLQPTRRRLPSGQMMDVLEARNILRYKEGLSVRAALGKPDRYPQRRKPVRESLSLEDLGD